MHLSNQHKSYQSKTKTTINFPKVRIKPSSRTKQRDLLSKPRTTRHETSFPRRPCLFPSGGRCAMGNQWQDVALICEPDAKNPPSAPAKFTTMTRAAISIMVACLLVIAVALPILHFREVGERGKPFFSLSFLVLLSGFL